MAPPESLWPDAWAEGVRRWTAAHFSAERRWPGFQLSDECAEIGRKQYCGRIGVYACMCVCFCAYIHLCIAELVSLYGYYFRLTPYCISSPRAVPPTPQSSNMQKKIDFEGKISNFCLPGIRKKGGGNDNFFFGKITHVFWGHAPIKKKVGNPFMKEFFDFDKKFKKNGDERLERQN